MCFIAKRKLGIFKPKEKTAIRDITVWKHVTSEVVNHIREYYPYFYSKHPPFKRGIRYHAREENGRIVNKFEVIPNFDGLNMWSIYEGIHSYKSKRFAKYGNRIMKSIIPKGEKYYEYNGELVSLSIVPVKFYKLNKVTAKWEVSE